MVSNNLYFVALWESWGLNQSGQVANNGYFNTSKQAWHAGLNLMYSDTGMSIYPSPRITNNTAYAPATWGPVFSSDNTTYTDWSDLGSASYPITSDGTTPDSGAPNRSSTIRILCHTYCYSWGDHHYNSVVEINNTALQMTEDMLNNGTYNELDSSSDVSISSTINMGIKSNSTADGTQNYKISQYGVNYGTNYLLHYGTTDERFILPYESVSHAGEGSNLNGKSLISYDIMNVYPAHMIPTGKTIPAGTLTSYVSSSGRTLSWTKSYTDTTCTVYRDGSAIASGLTSTTYTPTAAQWIGSHTWYVRENKPSVKFKLDYQEYFIIHANYTRDGYQITAGGYYYTKVFYHYYTNDYGQSNTLSTSYTGSPTFAWTKYDDTERSSGVYTLGYWKVKLKADVASDKAGTCGLLPSSVKFYLTSSKGGNHTSTSSATSSTTIISWESATAGYDVVWNTDDSISISCTYIYSDGTEKSTTVKYIPPILTNSGNGVHSRDSESSGKAVFSIAIIQSDLFYAQGSVISSSVKYNTVNDSTLRDASISAFSGGYLGYIYSEVSIPVDTINAPIGKSSDLSGINLYYYDAYSGKVIPDDTKYGSGNNNWDGIYFLKLTNPASVASDVSVVPNKIKITWDWTASTSTDKQNSDSYISGFKVYEGKTLIGTVASDKRELDVSASQGSHTYKVKAYCEGYSAIDSDFVAADNVVTSVLATPANFSATKSATDSATLTWDAVDGATGYDVYEGTTLLGTVTDNTVTYSSLSAGDHVYSVIASFTDTSYNSVATDQVTITISVLSVPNGLALTRNGLDGIDATWTAVSGASGYTILFDGTEHSVTSASYSATSLDSGNHTAKVKATF